MEYRLVCPYCAMSLAVVTRTVTPAWEKARLDWETDVKVVERGHCERCNLDFESETHIKALFPPRANAPWLQPRG